MLSLTIAIRKLNESKEGQVVCKSCGFKFNKGLAIKELTSKGDKYFCPKCNKEIKLSSSLNS